MSRRAGQGIDVFEALLRMDHRACTVRSGTGTTKPVPDLSHEERRSAMNPDQSAMDQFDLDVRVTTPRELADGFAAGGISTAGCTSGMICSTPFVAPGN
ncbi:FDLD family class I lanthipeptide [Allokutzneria oryzae]|uniref:FDLD family class I lanthipeptide n=1 Tax=Allokutzneria oryzae TaxID=1378989 RepID=A0ABV5ZSK7_9PSEU